MRRRRSIAALSALAAAAAIAGCGLSLGPGSSDATITVTRDFGAQSVGSPASQPKVPSHETVMRLLDGHYRVGTQSGGRFVESIDNFSAASDRLEWFYFVNGIQASKNAAATDVHKGDRVWFDLHDPSDTYSVPAVVGSFPEPFVNGVGGQRYPTTLECAGDVQSACDQVGAELRDDHVPVADQGLGSESGSDTLNVVVATFNDLGGSLAGILVSHGPGNSGIYARFVDGGSELELLNPLGQVTQVLGRGAGLVAATNDHVSQPEWLITGTDAAGVRAAASEVTPARLHDHFAVAVQGSKALPLPLDPGL